MQEVITRSPPFDCCTEVIETDGMLKYYIYLSKDNTHLYLDKQRNYEHVLMDWFKLKPLNISKILQNCIVNNT